ncbi:MAG: HepT-like ribonuclease domain-containing protein [Cyanobacteria bacterium P01_D01_bin.36]
MQQANHQYLVDILHAAQRILEYTDNTTLHSFYEDVQLQDKVVRKLLTIGKTAQRTSAATRQEVGGVNWPQLTKMKERLLQNEPVIDADQVWTIAQSEIPTLANVISDTVVSNEADAALFSQSVSV